MSDEKKESGSGLSVQTLLISSVSAVIATVVVSQFWEKGTLFFTAMVPITVALVSEALKRPADKITQVGPLVAPLKPIRRGPTGTAPHEPAVPEEARRTFPDAEAPEREDRFGLYDSEPRRRLGPRALKLGVATGLIAFLIGAAVVTASELALFDGSVGGGKGRTTLLGGSSSRSDTTEEQPTETNTTTTPEATPTPTETDEATPTPTPGEQEASPSPTPSPGATPTPSPAPGATPTPPDAAPPAGQATPAP